MILHLLLKSLFLSLRGFYLEQHTGQAKRHTTHDTASICFTFLNQQKRFGLSALLTNLIFQQQNLSLQSTNRLGFSSLCRAPLSFKSPLILSELKSDILVVAPLLQLNPSPTVALHQNGLV